MAAIELPDVLRFEVTVDEVVAATRAISRLTKRGKARHALARMLDELKTGNAALIQKVLLPLVTIADKKRFDAEFNKVLEHFKEMYLGQRSTLAEIGSYKVTLALQDLKKAQEWKSKLGFAQAIAKLELLTKNWIADDHELSEADKRMFGEINEFLVDVANTQNKIAAYRKFRAGAAGIERSYRTMQDRLKKLELLSAQVLK